MDTAEIEGYTEPYVESYATHGIHEAKVDRFLNADFWKRSRGRGNPRRVLWSATLGTRNRRCALLTASSDLLLQHTAHRSVDNYQGCYGMSKRGHVERARSVTPSWPSGKQSSPSSGFHTLNNTRSPATWGRPFVFSGLSGYRTRIIKLSAWSKGLGLG